MFTVRDQADGAAELETRLASFIEQNRLPDLFTIADGGSLPGGNVIFRRLADGRVASVLLMDSTWVRLDRVTA